MFFMGNRGTAIKAEDYDLPAAQPSWNQIVLHNIHGHRTLR